MSTYGPYTSWDADNTFNNQTARYVIPASAISTSGTYKITIKLGYRASSWTFDKVYVGHQAAAGDLWDFAAAPTAVLFSGVAGGTVGVGGLTSDQTTFSLDETKNLVISLFHSSSTNVPRDDGSTDYLLYYKAGDDAATQDATGYSTSASSGQAHFVEAIDLISPDITSTPPAGSLVFTGFAPGYNVYSIPAGSLVLTTLSPTLKVTQTMVAGSLVFTTQDISTTVLQAIPAGNITFNGEPVTFTGNAPNSYTKFPNVEGNHLSLKLASSDTNDGFILHNMRLKLFRTRGRFDVDAFPNLDGTHLQLKIEHTADSTFKMYYSSIEKLDKIE
jgi:hypothetical protein